MNAVVLESPCSIIYQKIPIWPIEDYGDPDLVLVKVAACGVCGSDFRYYAGENPWAQHTLGRHIENPPNIVLGHEFVGEVVAVLSKKNSHLLGKRVVPLCSKTCGVCSECRSGHSQLCPSTVHLGHGQGWGVRDFYPGAYAEYVPAWGSGCYEIPSNLSWEEAAMMDILAVCVHVASQGEIKPGRPVLIMGAGPAGNGIAQSARNLGASKVVITDHADIPLSIASDQGIDCVVDVRGKTNNALFTKLDSLAPEGYGSVFDSIGTEESFNMGLSLLGKAGAMVNMAVHDQSIQMNFMKLGSERKITTSCNFAIEDYKVALNWLESGRFNVRNWLTDIKLDEVPNIFADLHEGRTERPAFKMVVKLSGSNN
jgi:threonine dehydrogenase-like Zn-dependent dehydrogenase